MSKSDQIRALRELQFEQRRRAQAKASPLDKLITLTKPAKPSVINAIRKSVAERQAKWRAENSETNRQRARDGMRKRRASKKDNG